MLYIQADYVISAVPQAILNRIEFEPPLPANKIQLMQRIPMGSIIKTVMFYKTCFWRDAGFNGEMMTDKAPVYYCIDDTKPDGSHPAIMGFIQANNAMDLTHLSVEERYNNIKITNKIY
jgi:monoamine oxidase